MIDLKLVVDIREGIFKTIDIIIGKRLKELGFCYLKNGTIISKNKDGSYQVRMDNNIYTIKKFDKDDNRVYQNNDIVKILVENNDSSMLSIMCRKN